jgi:hypothetical protein
MGRKKVTDQKRWWYIGELIAVSLTSIAAVTGGYAWLLFGTVPLMVFWIWVLVLKSIREHHSRPA